MDWFSWLSKTNLDPSLVYDYALAFSRNQLQLEDAIYFNHDFLQSMGISIAKHRLEILKLAKDRDGAVVTSTTIINLSGVIKKCLKKCLNKLIFREEVKEMVPLAEPKWQQGKWRRALVSDELKGEKKGVRRSRTIAMSGPLDGRLMHDQKMMKVLKFSGPLDMITTRNPRFSGPLDSRVFVNNTSPRLARPAADEWALSPNPMGYINKTSADSDYDESSLWHALFQDLKPT